jgi:hypothetical protein
MTIDSMDHAIDLLRAVVIRLEGVLSPEDSANVWQLIDVGESNLAFDTLFTQLYEFDTQVDSVILSNIAEVGIYLNMDSDLWMDLKPSTGDANL